MAAAAAWETLPSWRAGRGTRSQTWQGTAGTPRTWAAAAGTDLQHGENNSGNSRLKRSSSGTLVSKDSFHVCLIYAIKYFPSYPCGLAQAVGKWILATGLGRRAGAAPGGIDDSGKEVEKFVVAEAERIRLHLLRFCSFC